MPLSTPLLAHLRDRLTPWLTAPAWRVGFSGGLDSTVLLHLLTRLREIQPLPPLAAIHVDHGLQPRAEQWAEHCQALCRTWRVPLTLARVRVEAGDSPEAAARDARYGAFARILGPDELLLLAHHRDDQAETLLFRLLRGAGVRGLAAIPEHRAFATGALARPLLAYAREQLLTYAQAQGLDWIDDPSNQDVAFARNAIRHHILPAMQAHWPQARRNLARAASHLRESQGLLEDLAGIDLAQAESPSGWPWLDSPSLALAPLAALSPARQRNALRIWLGRFCQLPDEAHWAGWQALRDAQPSATPAWRLGDGVLQRSVGRIWWLSGDWLKPPKNDVLDWPNPGVPLVLPGNGRLSLEVAEKTGPLRVRYRQGGEQLYISGRGHRDLKRLLNESGLPAFVRPRLPLVYQGDRLIAVANLPSLRGGAALGGTVLWRPPTQPRE